VYETDPVGITDQPAFLNMIVCIDTDAPAHELLHEALAIERVLGRVREVRWGPRSIDIDLLLYDGPPIVEPDLDLPHPRLAERQFVLVPLAEIAPDLILPDGRLACDAADRSDTSIGLVGTLSDCVAAEAQ
jgi:2-amino-4-hydroxy-6-hydroxymethyldihydropteridine diphosphokinase